MILTASMMLAICTVLSASDFRWIGGRWWGISVSYSLKWYNYSSGGHRHECNFWGEPGKMQGIRFGIPVEPVFYRGFGISSGIFGEVYSCKNSNVTMRIEQAGLYFPFHALYRHNFNDRFSVSIATGPALTVGLIQKVIDPTDSTKKGFHMIFNDGSPRRCDCLWEVSVGATYRMFRFSAVYSVGLTPSRHFLSTAGAMREFVSATPMVVSINAGIAF